MNVRKSGGGPLDTGKVTAEELELIGKLTKGPVTAEEVYTFRLLLCDNDVDRDLESFSDGALEALAEMFVGKTGIFDHNWSAHQQVARIFAAHVEETPGILTADGRPYKGLFAKAYMLAGEENRELIRAIEGGILKEVSIGCGMGRRVCSVCGAEYGLCGHEKGEEYEGKQCHVVLEEPSDAYEWSFVAVPAQRQAGVMKKYKGEDKKLELREFLTSGGGKAYLPELDRLEKEAKAGRVYLEELKDKVVRLGVLCGCGLNQQTLKSVADKLDGKELRQMEKAYEQACRELYPTSSQLTMAKKSGGDSPDEYLI